MWQRHGKGSQMLRYGSLELSEIIKKRHDGQASISDLLDFGLNVFPPRILFVVSEGSKGMMNISDQLTLCTKPSLDHSAA